MLTQGNLVLAIFRASSTKWNRCCCAETIPWRGRPAHASQSRKTWARCPCHECYLKKRLGKDVLFRARGFLLQTPRQVRPVTFQGLFDPGYNHDGGGLQTSFQILNVTLVNLGELRNLFLRHPPLSTNASEVFSEHAKIYTANLVAHPRFSIFLFGS